MKFLGFVFWCIVIFYIIGWLSRTLLRNWLQKKQREFESRMEDAQKQKQQEARGHHEGDVTVERIEVKKKQVNVKVGEYVEYEEVDKTTQENGK